MPRQIADYHLFRKKTKTSVRIDETIPIVTAVTSAELHSFLGSRDAVEVRRFLQRLRADGRLICRHHSLQAKLRGGELVYCFRGAAIDVERIGRPHRRARVLRWE